MGDKSASSVSSSPVNPSAPESSSAQTTTTATLEKGEMNNDNNINNNSKPSRPLGRCTTGFQSVPLPQVDRHPVQPGNMAAAADHPFALPPLVGSSGTTPAFNWPTYNTLVGLNPMNRNHASPLRLAPWFHPVAVLNEGLATAYADGLNTLPGDLPRAVTTSWDWRHRIAIPRHHLRRNSGETVAAAQTALTRMAYQRQSRAPFDVPVPPEFGFDVSHFRTCGKTGYGDNLFRLETLAWRNFPTARQEALCWERPIIRAEFHYLSRQYRSTFFQNFIRYERRWRSRFGYFIPYQNVEIELIAPPHRLGRYVALPEWWRFHEACWGCYIELPPVLTYLGSLLMQDPRSGLWSVVVTEWAARAAAYILNEAYDQFRLWFLPPRVRAAIRNLDLRIPLGGQANNEDVLQLLGYIDSASWSEVPLEQSGRLDGGSGNTGGPGLGTNTALAGDFIYFDPWEFREISSEEAHELRDAPRHVSEDHPVGYVDSDDYYHAYGGDDPMVDNEPEEPGEMDVEETGASVEAFPEGVSPAEPAADPSVRSAGPSIPNGVTANENEIIPRFLRGAILSAAEVSADVTTMADVLAYRLAGGYAPGDGEE